MNRMREIGEIRRISAAVRKALVPGAVVLATASLMAWPTSPACAQTPGTTAAARVAGTAKDVSKEYIIGADDVLEISVLNHRDLDKTLTVLPNGTVTYAWVGEMSASGKTPHQLASEIQRHLEQTLNNVIVSVTLVESRSRQVRVVGAVKTPGAYGIKPGWRLLDLAAAAGGLTNRPSRVTGRIIREGNVIPLKLFDANEHPDSDANPELQPDDLVYFEEADPSLNKVFVMGQVNKPGSYEIADDGINILSLLSVAGNVTETAALTRAYILRGQTEIPLNLRPLIIEGQKDDAVRDMRLVAGDVLFVPAIENQVGIMGQVNKPGFYPLPETRNLTPLDALTLAGGQTQTGDLKRAGVIRSVQGKPEIIPIDVEEMLKRGNLTANLKLEPNDVLYVPSKNQKSSVLKDVLGPITSLALLGVRLFN